MDAGRRAVDSVDITLPVNQERSADGITIRLGEVHVSSKEVVVTLSTDAGVQQLQTPFANLRMFLPDGLSDGKMLLAEGGGGSSQDPPGTFKAYRFPALPPGVRQFTISVEPFLSTQARSLAFPFSLASNVASIDINADTLRTVPVGVELGVSGETFRLDHVQFGHQMNVVVQNVTSGTHHLSFGAQGPATLVDANGRTYQETGGRGGFNGMTSFRFQDVDLTAVANMQLRVGRSESSSMGPGI